jgi:hypothetical protein
MGQRLAKCGLCTHPERGRIEALRVAGSSFRVLERQFAVSKDIICRHFRDHVSPARKAELSCGPAKLADLANAAADESRSLLDYLAITRTVLFNQFLTAAETGDRPSVAHVAGKLLACLEQLGRLSGELRVAAGVNITNNTVNLIGSPEFTALSAGLLGIARAHPEARADIIALLRGLDSAPALPKPNGARPQTIEGEVHAAI